MTSVLFNKGKHGVQRAANLERKRGLKRFEFEKDLAVSQRRQPFGSAKRCAQNAPIEPVRSGSNGVDGNQVRVGLAAMRISASRDANADRAITSSSPARRASSIKSVCTCDTKPSVRMDDSSGSCFSVAIV